MRGKVLISSTSPFASVLSDDREGLLPLIYPVHQLVEPIILKAWFGYLLIYLNISTLKCFHVSTAFTNMDKKKCGEVE